MIAWRTLAAMFAVVIASVAGCREQPSASVRLAMRTERDVTVDIRLVRTAGSKTRSLCGTFSPTRPGFHLYAIDLPDEGINGIGRPTRLRLVQSAALRATGATTADRKAVSMKVEPLGLKFPVYPAGPVTICQPVEVADSGNRSAEIALTYMTCSEQVCMPPVTDRRIVVTVIDPRENSGVRD
jgi:hypothetical protein